MSGDRLDLADRTGLPDTIAYLRAAHPAAGWAAHRNFGDLGAFWLHVHAQLRQEGAQVAATIAALRDTDADHAAPARTLAAALNAFLGHLDQHHRIEDAAYFPRFRTLDARMVTGFDLLERDHTLIDRVVAATVTSARTLMSDLARAGHDHRAALDAHAMQAATLTGLLDRHLGDEEDLVIPALLEHGERALG